MSNLKLHPIIQQYIEWNAFGKLLGMDFEIIEAGRVIYKMEITEDKLATPFAAHGGSVAALIDAALGVACLSKVCESNRIVSTVALTVQYLHPAFKNDVLSAEGHVIKAGNRILFVEGKVYNQKGETIAISSATMNAYPVEKAIYTDK